MSRDLGILEDLRIGGRRDADDLCTDPRNVPAAKAVVDKFMAEGYTPEGHTLYTYAAIQPFAAAAGKAGSFKVDDLSKALK